MTKKRKNVRFFDNIYIKRKQTKHKNVSEHIKNGRWIDLFCR